MRGSWRIAQVAGIDLSIHWTFGLLLAWVLLSSTTGGGLWHGLVELVFILVLFGCVVLHELGHALAARVFRIPTHGITLLPIGGVAQLDRIPRDPWQEWVIALAGPAVNTLIVGLLFPLTAVLHGTGGAAPAWGTAESLMVRLMWVNVMLVAFNLLPAFPMDGGRILRSWFALRTDYLTATLWAKRFGQLIAVLFAVWGFSANPLLVLIAVFVFLAAESEYRAVLNERNSTEGISTRGAADAPLSQFESEPVDSQPLPAPVDSSGPLDPPNFSGHWILPNRVVVVHTYPTDHAR